MRRILLSILLALVVGWPAAPVLAGPGKNADAAVRQAERETGGRAVRVDRVEGGYAVRVLMPNGVVRTVFVRAD